MLTTSEISAAPAAESLYSDPPEPAPFEKVPAAHRFARKPLLVETPPRPVEILRACVITFDLVVLVTTGIAQIAVSQTPSAAALPIILATLATGQMIRLVGQYRASHLTNLWRQAGVVLSAAAMWLLIALCAAWSVPSYARANPVPMTIGAGLAAAAMMTMRGYARWQILRWTRAGALRRRVAIVGVNQVSLELIRNLKGNPTDAIRLTGVYGVLGEDDAVTHGGLLVRGRLSDLIRHARSGEIDLVVIALPPDRLALVRDLRARLSIFTCDVGVFSGPATAYAPHAILEPLGETLSVAVTPRPLSGTRDAWKAVFDAAAAAALLLILAPVLCMIMLAIRLDSPGPIFFRQQRFGLNQKPFNILKFRTMRHELADLLADRQTSVGDDRVTRVGRWLRRTSLDELPQLINVLTSDMSLVGPRPHAPGTRAGARPLDEVAQDYLLRHRVKPGITGLAQINGCRGAIRDEEQLIRRTEYDLFYIDSWSFGLDLKILALTLIRGFIGKNAY